MQASTHRLDRRREPLARQHLPRGEHLGPIAAQERVDVAGEVVGLLTPSGDRNDRLAQCRTSAASRKGRAGSATVTGARVATSAPTRSSGRRSRSGASDAMQAQV